MTTPAVKTLTALADDLDSAVTALGGVRGRDRDDLIFVLGRIRETATKAMESVEKAKKRKAPSTTDAGFDTENDWSTIIVRRE
jgi:hypothetical protein